MTDPVKLDSRASKILFVTWLLSGAAIATTFLYVWPFPVEFQIGALFLAFAVLCMMKSGYYKPVKPLAFLLGTLVPYLIAYAWLRSLLPETK